MTITTMSVRPLASEADAGKGQILVPVNRLTIALAGVRAARREVCRATGLLRQAIHVAASEGVSVERLAQAAGTSIDQVQRIARHPDEERDANALPRIDRDGRGGPS